jgi:hypothetical protein
MTQTVDEGLYVVRAKMPTVTLPLSLRFGSLLAGREL